MKTYIADIIPKIQRFSEKLDNLTLMTNQHWVVLDELANSKTVYIFRSSGELLISVNGKVDRAKWEYLGQNSILIDLKEESYLFKHGFFDENVLALKIDSKEEYAVLINESKYDGELSSISAVTTFLNQKYLLSPQLSSGTLIQDITKKKDNISVSGGGNDTEKIMYIAMGIVCAVICATILKFLLDHIMDDMTGRRNVLVGLLLLIIFWWWWKIKWWQSRQLRWRLFFFTFFYICLVILFLFAFMR